MPLVRILTPFNLVMSAEWYGAPVGRCGTPLADADRTEPGVAPAKLIGARPMIVDDRHRVGTVRLIYVLKIPFSFPEGSRRSPKRRRG
jgi:hypothetical protein